MAEVYVSAPNYNDLEVVVLPSSDNTEAKRVTNKELIMMLRYSLPKPIHHIEV